MSAPTAEWECVDPFFNWPEVRELRPGVLDEDAEHVFTSGHCHSFAEAVCRLTPAAQLVFAFDLPVEGRGSGRAQGHVLVQIAGRYLDARGWADELADGEDGNRGFESDWDRIQLIGPEGWLAIYSSGWLTPRVSDALPFAAALLRRLGLPPEDTRRRTP